MVEITDVTGDSEIQDGVHRRNVNTTAAAEDSDDGTQEEESGDSDEEEEAEEAEAPQQELTFNQQVDQARERMQPTPLEKILAIVKSLFLRALVIYFVMSFIRGNSSKGPVTNSTGGATAPGTPLTSSNIYPNGTEYDMKD